MIELLQKYQPEMWSVAQRIKRDVDWSDSYNQFQNVSIDFAIMEKLDANDLSYVPCSLGWSDVGSWEAIAEIKSTLSQSFSVDGKGNVAISMNDKVYGFCGVDDVIVVNTQDATLVLKKGSDQNIKRLLQKIANQKPDVVDSHLFEYRPWGKFEVLGASKLFKAKVIEVAPGQQLSYQSHSRREEHWIVIEGDGEVVVNDLVTPVKKGAYIHIPIGAKHRMRNTGLSSLRFVEVQMGSYFGEDDIIRYQDDYHRA